MREPFPGAPVSLDCTVGGCEDHAIRWAFSADPLAWTVTQLERERDDALALAEQAADIARHALGPCRTALKVAA
jgi:hypothetical protein